MSAIPSWAGSTSRKICKRIVVEGDLILLSPVHFGNGDSDEFTDMPLLVDPLDEKTPLLTGASLAGSLRSALRSRQFGLRCPYPALNDFEGLQRERNSWAVDLFGGFRMDDRGEQSPLIVDDSYGTNAGIEIRSGNGISGASRTAAKDKLFTAQFWQAGTTFQLHFELVVRSSDDEMQLKSELAAALEELERGRLSLGARSRRGFGIAQVKKWRVLEYDLQKQEDLLNWLKRTGKEKEDTDIHSLLGVNHRLPDHRKMLELTAYFKLPHSMLIRSGSADDVGPDFVFLSARQSDGITRPIISGTSLAGALRSRAFAICSTVGSEEKAAQLVNSLFGEMSEGKTPQASRLVACETVIEEGREDLVQSRVSLDRFTGGARETALFDEQPVWGLASTHLRMILRIENPTKAEFGLVLHLLKDLWNADLALGGEGSVGRGRLQGTRAEIYWTGDDKGTWVIESADDPTKPAQLKNDSDLTKLNDYADELKKALQEVAYER